MEQSTANQLNDGCSQRLSSGSGAVQLPLPVQFLWHKPLLYKEKGDSCRVGYRRSQASTPQASRASGRSHPGSVDTTVGQSRGNFVGRLGR
jgi:hypothetical protein